jgi:prolyl oligopeptidase PreP (S9A serine peptidase family)
MPTVLQEQQQWSLQLIHLNVPVTAELALLFAGGFNVSLEPGFSASRLTWMRGYNGVFAQANLRGGGEYGRDWRDAGSKANKQNVFDDFQVRYCKAEL